MRNLKYPRLFTIPLLFALLLLGGCDVALLNPKGYIGHEIKALIITSVCLMLIVVIPAIFMSLYFPFKYREGSNAKYSPKWEFSAKIETLVWGVPVIIIIILGIVTYHYTHKIDPTKPIPTEVSATKQMDIQVVALRWKWLFIYPEQGIATVNQVVFPENTPIKFEITSDTAITSFLIPQLGSQIYAMAGMETKLHLIADKPGVFQGTAANFIGYGYSYMLFKAVSVSHSDFEKWVADVKAGTAKDQVDGNEITAIDLTPNVYKALRDKRNEDFFEPVAFYKLTPSLYGKDGLFEDILESYIPVNGPKGIPVKDDLVQAESHNAISGGH